MQRVIRKWSNRKTDYGCVEDNVISLEGGVKVEIKRLVSNKEN